MTLRTLVTPLVALLVAVHGVPLAAIAPLLGCPQGVEIATVKEGDHCERKPVRKEHRCPHHRARGAKTTGGGTALYSAACSCRHSAAMTASASDPAMRPPRVALVVEERCRAIRVVTPPSAGGPATTPPSPPPRATLS